MGSVQRCRPDLPAAGVLHPRYTTGRRPTAPAVPCWVGEGAQLRAGGAGAQVLDAVVTDPPYGVRAGGRKAKSRPETRIEDRSTHITATEPYTFGACRRSPIYETFCPADLPCTLRTRTAWCWPGC